MARNNPHTGSNFDDYLKEEGVFDEVQAKALKRALAEQLDLPQAVPAELLAHCDCSILFVVSEPPGSVGELRDSRAAVLGGVDKAPAADVERADTRRQVPVG